MGRVFLREIQTLDIDRHQLLGRPLVVHDIPIVAFLPGEEETLTFWLKGEELQSTPDTGSEIVMSYDFAIGRFNIQPGATAQVRFANGATQSVEGKVSIPVSFGNGAPPSTLLKLVDLTIEPVPPQCTPGPDGAVNYGATASILADFHVFKGLKVDIIIGEDLLATVNAFVRHSSDFQDLIASESEYPGLCTILSVGSAAKSFLGLVGKSDKTANGPDQRREEHDQEFLDYYRAELTRIGRLTGLERLAEERKLVNQRQEYDANRTRTALNASPHRRLHRNRRR